MFQCCVGFRSLRAKKLLHVLPIKGSRSYMFLNLDTIGSLNTIMRNVVFTFSSVFYCLTHFVQLESITCKEFGDVWDYSNVINTKYIGMSLLTYAVSFKCNLLGKRMQASRPTFNMCSEFNLEGRMWLSSIRRYATLNFLTLLVWPTINSWRPKKLKELCYVWIVETCCW